MAMITYATSDIFCTKYYLICPIELTLKIVRDLYRQLVDTNLLSFNFIMHSLGLIWITSTNKTLFIDCLIPLYHQCN